MRIYLQFRQRDRAGDGVMAKLSVRAMTCDSASQLEELLRSLPAEVSIISIYGLSGRHVAWVKFPEPQTQQRKDKKGNMNV